MLTAILIDDEKNSRDALQKKLQAHCPEIKIVALCNNGIEGIAAIKEHHPAVIFLDIEMPHMNGFTMLEQLTERDFAIVFTTAYNQYAINAIRYGAFDYLVKPVDVNELKVVVKRVSEIKQQHNTTERLNILLTQLQQPAMNKPQKIAVATHEGLELVPVDAILYMEAEGNYTHLYFTGQKPLLASKTLKEFEDLLEGAGFFRIHNASLVNLVYVKKYIKGDGGQVQLTNNVVLDVARRRKEELLDALMKIAPKI
ncbi:MAG TPA: LytTR family DNA-binding domain-containing protein [Ferruginibacter sp.]|nr:LytTR family DNA-binding domain-containing protein [Ferruginibacter sp.]HPH90183.1 LytTR family DNA-binding domain-containing protein [Ferruginibacter sp.]